MDITFLKEEQIWGDEALQVIKDYGTEVGSSDLAVILGARMGCSGPTTFDGFVKSHSLTSASFNNLLVTSNYKGEKEKSETPRTRCFGARPVISLPENSLINTDKTKFISTPNNEKIKVCEYGEYPQEVADNATSEKLESLYNRNLLTKLYKKYTFTSEKLESYARGFEPQQHFEYELNEKKYIRRQGNPCNPDSRFGHNSRVFIGEIYWIEVQPIEWLVDPTGVWVSKKNLFAGIQFDANNKYDGDFSKTFMKSYLDTYFAKEMMAKDFAKEIETAKSILESMPVTEIANNNEQVQNIETEILIDAAASMEFYVQNAVLLARKDEILKCADLRSKIQKSMEAVLKKNQNNNATTVSNYILYNKICNSRA